nr:hypothetical protein [Tanacetum cinerariifolium]
GKGCSGVETPLFENMLPVREEDAEEEVQVPTHDVVDQENVVEETADDVIPAAEPVVAAVSTPISAAKPKGLKFVPAAPTVSTRKRK